MKTSRNRRDFLKNCCALGAVGMASQLERLGMVTAHAQSASNYKALVCVFLFGGNDANNTIVPLDSRYDLYRAMRRPRASGGVAFDAAELISAGATGYGLHPALTNTQRLFTQNRAAAVFRSLSVPGTRTYMRSWRTSL